MAPEMNSRIGGSDWQFEYSPLSIGFWGFTQEILLETLDIRGRMRTAGEEDG